MLRQSRPDQPTKLQTKYRERPLHVMEVLPGDTYRVAELASDGREVYATTAHTSQLKSWKILRHTDSKDEAEGEDLNDEGDIRQEVDGEDQNNDGDVQHEVEGEDHSGKDVPTSIRSRRTKRQPAYLPDYMLD